MHLKDAVIFHCFLQGRELLFSQYSPASLRDPVSNPLALKPLIDNAVNLLRKHQKREIKDVPNLCLAKYDTEIN